MKNSRAQIIATIGPASIAKHILESMIQHQMDVVRFNLSWANPEERLPHINLIKELSAQTGKKIPIILDLPGPRVKQEHGHKYDENVSGLTDYDKSLVEFGIENGVDYLALSFVGGTKEIEMCREIIREKSGMQKIIAKIERSVAVEVIDKIIESADAIMIARGDLGSEVPLEQIPFIQKDIILKTKAVGKPVIVATQMLLSMVNEITPTRAEVTDVSEAIMQGADAVMLSEETAIGKYPVLAVEMMERIVSEAEKHLLHGNTINSL